jgi:hypothetical protein
MPETPAAELSDTLVVVRRRWNDPQLAQVPFGSLRDPVVKSDPGGVCSPIPRPFLFARVWCDALVDGGPIHACDGRSAPHELELCVLEKDNPAPIYAALRRQGRR